MFWAEVAQNWTFWLSYLVCCRWACWFAQRCFTMCRHTLVAQHFCPISIFLSFWLFVAKSNVFFSMAFFRFCRTPQTCHVVIQSPKPQPSCPHKMWWRSILAGFAIFVPGQGVPGPQGRAKGGKLLWNVQSAQHAKFGGQTKCPALGVARPHDALPCTGGQMGW